MAPSEDFAARMFARVLAATHHNEVGVDGEWGYALPLRPRRRLVDGLETAATRAGFSRRYFSAPGAGRLLADIASRSEGLAATEGLLRDEASRSLLIDVLAARVLGEHHVRLPVTQSSFRAICARIDAEQRTARDQAFTPEGVALHRYDVPTATGVVNMIGSSHLVAEFFEEQQYAFRRAGRTIAAESGDVVVDAGGGWGETALYFADAVGSTGRVLAFEFVPENLRLVERNLALNPRLAERITVIPHPVWDVVGEPLSFTSEGGQTSVATPVEQATEGTTSETIDHVCAVHGLERVDLIKLDVEGAEQAALRGAEETIRRCRPKLAISLYHSLDDFVAIPAWVEALDVGYDLHLEHRWPGLAETMLFAQAA